MKHPHVLFVLFCVLAGTVSAQTEIGGGTCSSATLTGTYAITLTGRQASATGSYTNVFDSNGTATFDGLSKATLSLTAYTLASTGTSLAASAGTPLQWVGTYSIQSNCAGQVTITSGGSATLNIVSYDGGADLLLTGNDATYAYTGSGNNQPSTCSASALSGLYSFNGSGYGTTNGVVSSAGDAVGILQFDGKGNLTVNVTIAGAGQSASAGPYTVSPSSSCLGSATLAASNGKNTYMMNFTIENSTATAVTDFFATFAIPGGFVTGGGHAISGQPTAAAARRGGGSNPAGEVVAALGSAVEYGRAQ